MNETLQHLLVVRDRPTFLHRLMVELAGDARMSIEGDLSQCRFTDDVVIGHDATALLTRQTAVPVLGFLVLRLAPETVDPIFKQVMAAGLKRAIIHVHIERAGVLEMAACDNFHPECVWTGPGISRVLLEELRDNNVLRDFEAAPPSP